MTFALQAGFDVAIAEPSTGMVAERDIYRLADLPRDLRELVVAKRACEELEWFAPDGSCWRVRPAFV